MQGHLDLILPDKQNTRSMKFAVPKLIC